MNVPHFLGSPEAHLNLVPALCLAGAAVMLFLEVYGSIVLHTAFQPDRFMQGYGILISAGGLGAGGQRFLATLNNRFAPPAPGNGQ
ncbi:hypothetical protein [Acidiphilium angustum]|uniref:hypothetical protein n=1 Tax=Acidiphilium angustum TaxID=523 RepID=UPI00049497A1|nr:hypothetical protein [Acidiphilium angustum]